MTSKHKRVAHHGDGNLWLSRDLNFWSIVFGLAPVIAAAILIGRDVHPLTAAVSGLIGTLLLWWAVRRMRTDWRVRK